MLLFPDFLPKRPFIPLTTQRLTLRLPCGDDVASLVACFQDASVVRYLSRVPFPYRPDDAIEKIAKATAAYAERASLFLVIEHRDTRTIIGTIELQASGELGYAFARSHWRQGYGKEAVYAFVQFAFALLELNEVRACSHVENTASSRLLISLGFEWMGREQDDHVYVLNKRAFETAQALKIFAYPLIFASAAFLVRPDHSFLVAQLPPHKSFPGTWELPGGKLDPGETPQVALVRELEEELGIHVHTADLVPLSFCSHAIASKRVVVFFYLCQLWEGEPHGKEGQNLAWIQAKELPAYPPPAPDLAAFHALATHLGFYR